MDIVIGKNLNPLKDLIVVRNTVVSVPYISQLAKSFALVAIESIEQRKEVGGSIPHLKYSYFLPYSIMHYGLVDIAIKQELRDVLRKAKGNRSYSQFIEDLLNRSID